MEQLMSKERINPRQFAHVQAVSMPADFALNEEQIKELASLYTGTLDTYKQGSIIQGVVLRTSSDGVLVDIGFKSDGLIPLYEFSEHEFKKLSTGAPIEVIIDELENADGNVILSYEKAKAQKAWAVIMKMFEEGKPVEGTVLHKVKGGLSVDIGMPAFLPGSQVDVQRVADFDTFVGQTITAYIIKVNQKRGNVIISRRKYLGEQRAESRKKVLDDLSVGQVIQGTVKNITNYGVFIDIGGVDGLLHITDMTWGRIAHPSEMVKIGDTVTVKVLTLDKDNEKISLGIKQLAGNPWEQLPESVKVGEKVKGIIASITDYGLFIEVAKGVEGLVHISEISWTDRITDLHKHYKVGQEIEALVVSLDKENRRMSLSIKQLEKNPWEAIADQFTIGQRITGKVSNITDFGIFVQLMPGVDGLVHISDLSWTEHVKHPADIFKKGDEVEAIITDINKQKKKISLGIKQLTENPWENIEQKYPVGTVVSGEVTKITDFGAFVKLPSGIEGLVHISEFPQAQADALKVGQAAEFKVIKVSQEDHKLGLTLNTSEEHVEKRGGRRQQPNQMSEKSTQPQQQRKQQEAPKGKSQFQLELEKHAARKSSHDEE